MYLARVVAVILLLALLSSLAVAQTPANSLMFLDSSGAGTRIARERLETCLNLVSRELGVAGRPLPSILVLHASPQAARAAGVQHTTVIVNTPEDGARSYQFWIVGKPSYVEYTAAMYDILEDYDQVRLPETERKEIMTRVIRFLRNTISARSESESAPGEAAPESRP